MTWKKTGNFLLNNAIVLMMILAAVVVGILEPTFISVDTGRNLIVNIAIRFIVALGVSGCLITKGTDLSAGRSVGLAACLAASFLQADSPGQVHPTMDNVSIVLVFLGVIMVSTLFGTANGLVVSYLKVPPFIATLGMQTIIYGICMIYTNGTPIGGLRADYTDISQGVVKYMQDGVTKDIKLLPYLGLIALALGLVMWFIYNKTPHGKYMYAIGGNESSAEVSGINTNATKIIIYATAGLLYGITGFLIGAKSGGANVGMGLGYELEAIAGCTIGGVSTNGGVGRVSGILIGVLVFELLKMAMQFMGVDTDYTYIIQGLVIIIAVAIDIRKYVAKK